MKSHIHVVAFADTDDTSLAAVAADKVVDVHEILCRDNITLVLCSSMTRAELDMCQQELGIRHPFICESGAAVLVPHQYFPFDVPHDRGLSGFHAIEFGRPYAEVTDILHRTATRLGIDVVGFSDMSVEQVATECNLSLSHARLAKLREYDEPFRMVRSNAAARDRLFRALDAAGLACTYQGPYNHVGAAVDKGTSVGLLTALYRRAFSSIVTVGLGDATNSAALLRRVSMPFIVETEQVGSHSRLLPRIPRIRLAAGFTPWVEAIVEIARQARDRRETLRRVQATG